MKNREHILCTPTPFPLGKSPNKYVVVQYKPLKSPLKPFFIKGKYYNRDEANALGYNKKCSKAILKNL